MRETKPKSLKSLQLINVFLEIGQIEALQKIARNQEFKRFDKRISFSSVVRGIVEQYLTDRKRKERNLKSNTPELTLEEFLALDSATSVPAL